jgi:predicted PurR-regulated permease PerM
VAKTCQAVIIGAVLSGVAHGLLIGVAYWIFDIPHPLMFAVITGILSFVPMIGSIPTAWGGVLYLLIDGRTGAALGMCVAAVVTAVSDNVLKPWVLKGKIELHPLLGLTSALGGASLFGFSGLFLGPLIAALTIELIKIVPVKRVESEAAPAKK